MRRHRCVVGSPVRALARRMGAGMLLTLTAGLLAAGSAMAAPDAWTAIGSLSTGRVESAVAVLPSGKVLMAGGFDTSGQSLASTEIYNPASHAWSAGGAMPAGRGQAAAVTLQNGQVLVVGGETDGSSTDPTPRSALLYDPTNDSFTPTAGTLRDGRTDAGITLLPDGDAMVIGGYDPVSGAVLSSTEVYDPASGTFSPGPDMGGSRENMMVTALPGGDILVAGGDDGIDALTTAVVLDPVESQWTQTANPMSSARQSGGVVSLPGGRVLLAGGIDASGASTDTTDIYDPATNSFAAGASMATARAGFGIARLANGEVVVAGGVDAEAPGRGLTGLASTEIYDPGRQAWSAGGDLPVGVILPALVPLANGELLEAGGTADFQQANAQAAVFDPPFAPGAPTGVTATPGDGHATVTWTAASADGAPVTGYTVTASTGQVVTLAGDVTSTTVTGLTNGTPVTFTVTATNAGGTSLASAPSSTVTPTISAAPSTAPGGTTPPAGTTPPTGSRPARDKAATLRLSGLASRMTLKAFFKGLHFTVTPSKSVALQVTVTKVARPHRALAGKRFQMSTRKRAVNLVPSRKRVGHPRSVKVRVTVIAIDPAGTRSTVTRTLTIKG
jgi:hypothetical protein